jgi:AcrR family transcriptional regulator
MARTTTVAVTAAARRSRAGARKQHHTPDARIAGMIAAARLRKQDSRARLLAAGVSTFCKAGYVAVSVEDIALAAGVSRVTFYRHFNSKADLALELFRQTSAAAMPDFLRIGQSDYRDRTVVASWIGALFAADRANGRLLRVFTHATIDDASFTQRAQEFISALITQLGATIAAFHVHPDRPGERRQWLKAWLMLYEILDQSNHAALDSGVATDPLVIDLLTDRFVEFVSQRTAS